MWVVEGNLRRERVLSPQEHSRSRPYNKVRLVSTVEVVRDADMVCAYQRPHVQPSFKTTPLFKNFLFYMRTVVLAYHMTTIKTSISFSVNGLAILTNKYAHHFFPAPLPALCLCFPVHQLLTIVTDYTEFENQSLLLGENISSCRCQ